MFEINGVKLEFDVFDADVYEKYATAKQKLVEDLSKTGKGDPAMFRKQCNAVKEFFDYTFREGTGVAVCGEKDNLKVCINAFCEVAKEDERQAAELNETNEYFAKIAASGMKSPNRAERRKSAAGSNKK